MDGADDLLGRESWLARDLTSEAAIQSRGEFLAYACTIDDLRSIGIYAAGACAYLDVEGVEDGLLDGGDVGVEDGHVHLLQHGDGLDQLLRPAARQDLDHRVLAQHAHLDVRQARLVLGHLLPEPAAARVEVDHHLGTGSTVTVPRPRER